MEEEQGIKKNNMKKENKGKEERENNCMKKINIVIYKEITWCELIMKSQKH